jgi:hypothetical protein
MEATYREWEDTRQQEESVLFKLLLKVVNNNEMQTSIFMVTSFGVKFLFLVACLEVIIIVD